MRPFLLLFISALVVISCSLDKKPEENLFELAKAHSAKVVESIETGDFSSYFNRKHFPDTLKIKFVSDDMKYRCKASKKNIHYYDYFKEILRDTTKIDKYIFFYEGFTECGNIRFQLNYTADKEKKEITLTQFQVQEGSAPNDIVKLIQERRIKEQEEKSNP